jgi:hypothetical protein
MSDSESKNIMKFITPVGTFRVYNNKDGIPLTNKQCEDMIGSEYFLWKSLLYINEEGDFVCIPQGVLQNSVLVYERGCNE